MLDTYFKHHIYPFTKHHIDSFHDMFKTHIPNTIRSYNPIVMLKTDDNKGEIVRVEVWVGSEKSEGGIYVDRPTYTDHEGMNVLMTPQDARLRNLTYATKLYADVTVKYFTDGEQDPFHTDRFPHTILGRIPIMLHSDQCVLHNQGSKVVSAFGECPMDAGGYFIVEGKEKVIVSQERITTNRLFVSKLEGDKHFSHRGYIHCTGSSGETALSPRTVEFLLVKHPEVALLDGTELPDKKKGVRKETLATGGDDELSKIESANMRKISGAILVSLPSIKGRLPLTTVFRAFGIESDKDIIEAICGPIDSAPLSFLNFLRPSIAHVGPLDARGIPDPVYTTVQAMNKLESRVYFKSIDHLKTIIATDVFPNIEGDSNILENKAKYLACLVSTFMRTALGILPESDRDGFVFKRIDVSGMLLSQLFQETYIKFRNGIRDRLDRKYYYEFKSAEIQDMVKMVTPQSLPYILYGSPMDPNYDIITKAFTKSLKGMWGPITDDPELGIVQDLSRISYIGTLSHLRRVNNGLDRSIKLTSPHRLHSQQWGVICPFESPDGASIGYLKNFALLTHVTFGTSPSSIVQTLQLTKVTSSLASLSTVFLASRDVIKVFINGTLYGITTDPVYMIRVLRLFRRNGLLSQFIAVAWNIKENEIRINTDAGRPCRPLFIVQDGIPLIHKVKDNMARMDWDDMVLGSLLSKSERDMNGDKFVNPFDLPIFAGKDMEGILSSLENTTGCIEYLDIEEANTMLIAMTPSDLESSSMMKFYTHMEIHPSTAFSVVTHLVPFANCNQAPRVYFHGAQSKQAIGTYTTNWHNRYDTAGYIQHYPQRRIVGTRGCHYNGNDRMPDGFNVIVAVATHTGFNQEDSIMINRRAIDRGLFKLTVFKSITASEKILSATEKVMFAHPISMRDGGEKVSGISHANYDLIRKEAVDASHPAGIISEEAYIPRGQKAVVVGMIHVTKTEVKEQDGLFTTSKEKLTYKDVSLTTDVNHYGTIDRVFVGTTVPGNPERICKVRFRKVRRPTLGDKHCSRHAQKGVIGMILEHENMPFTKDGIVPDLIINPHAFPTRMTMGHLLETVFAKLCCLDGCIGDGTVFIPFDKDKVFDGLNTHGLDKHGNEVMYDGRTGNQIETDIFIGPIFYYRLKHMVDDKVQSRGSGPDVKRTQLTHQPTEGRSAGGGLRIGEMERDVLIGHGMANFLKESMMEKSDKYRWMACRHCGTIARFNPLLNMASCGGCGLEDVAVVDTPYTLKLLIQEFECMGVQMRISVDPIEKQENTQKDDESSTTTDESVDSEPESEVSFQSGGEFEQTTKATYDALNGINQNPVNSSTYDQNTGGDQSIVDVPETPMDIVMTPETPMDAGMTPETSIDAVMTPGTSMDAVMTPETPMDGGMTPETSIDAVMTPEIPMDAGMTPETPIDAGMTPETPMDTPPQTFVAPQQMSTHVPSLADQAGGMNDVKSIFINLTGGKQQKRHENDTFEEYDYQADNDFFAE